MVLDVSYEVPWSDMDALNMLVEPRFPSEH